MGSIKGSEQLQSYAGKIARSLSEHNKDTHPPDAQKVLRSFSMREASDFLGVNPNTFRSYVKSHEGEMPTGTLVNGTRRVFTMEEIGQIRTFLFQKGRVGLEFYPIRQNNEHLQVVTCFNLKGGVSKTTSAVNQAMLMAARGFRVLVIDIDAQASCTNLFGLNPEADESMLTAYDVIRYQDPSPIRNVIRKTYFPGLDLIPSSMEIVEFEYETALSFRDPGGAAPFHARMARALDDVKDDYDLVIYDTPPQMSFAVISALFASTGMVIPLTASMLDVMSLSTFLSMAGDLMKVVEAQASDKRYDFIRFLITRYEATDQPQLQMASYLRTILGDAVMASTLIKSTAIGDAANTTQPMLEVDPKEFNRRTYDRIMESLNDIADELQDDIYIAWGRAPRRGRHGA